ncbi:hypothetical protein HanXRQr2_Chr07g0298331 [Helianthus annuus]|uniref:Uncharacterized protein n=1 Tax=Helianthus annuus TaxID=4232 RepID=A0A9K3IL26_HELAN|nr:hypothetical protein HanXRQr2_Chr07g0298331 [Helianthus annuus]KAJ0904996.1 hypothetical protein HanPSC8_Chr07g0288821 [Helianthus annuus]
MAQLFIQKLRWWIQTSQNVKCRNQGGVLISEVCVFWRVGIGSCQEGKKM